MYDAITFLWVMGIIFFVKMLGGMLVLANGPIDMSEGAERATHFILTIFRIFMLIWVVLILTH